MYNITTSMKKKCQKETHQKKVEKINVYLKNFWEKSISINNSIILT